MRQPGVESTCPLAQVELRKEWLVHRFQGCQDVAHFFAGVTCNAAEGFEFVKAAAELEPGGIRQIERLLVNDLKCGPLLPSRASTCPQE